MILGYIARPAENMPNNTSYVVFTELEFALNHAKTQARVTNKPWAVYKVVQTHHVSCPAVVVDEVK